MGYIFHTLCSSITDADVFYNKRFLLEKEVRINMLLMDENDEPPVIVDVTDL